MTATAIVGDYLTSVPTTKRHQPTATRRPTVDIKAAFLSSLSDAWSKLDYDDTIESSWSQPLVLHVSHFLQFLQLEILR